MGIAITSAPPSATSWVAAVSSADFTTGPQLPIAVYVPTGGSIVVNDQSGSAMTLGAGLHFVRPASLGTVTGSCFALFQ